MKNTININDITLALNAIQLATKRGTFSLEEVEVILNTTVKFKEAIKAYGEQVAKVEESKAQPDNVENVDFSEAAF